jgi:hypothetical protein
MAALWLAGVERQGARDGEGATRIQRFRRSIVPSGRFELYLVPQPMPVEPPAAIPSQRAPEPQG